MSPQSKKKKNSNGNTTHSKRREKWEVSGSTMSRLTQHLNRNKAEEAEYICIIRNRPSIKNASNFNMVAQIITSRNYTAPENKNKITIQLNN